tara:strand:- start:160 stop:726 length:567 start_codon:yes stop_codon:yes gene_type:complete
MDPLTLAAVTGGFAAVKSAVQGVRTALNTAEDVGAIAGQIDRLFKTHSEAKKRIASVSKDKKLKNNKWAKFVKFKLKDDSDDETSLANVAAAKLAEKQQEEDIKRLSLEINKRFGIGTWDEILDEQKKLIAERQERIKKQKEEEELKAERKALQQREVWQTILIESGKVLVVALFIAGVTAFIWYNKA